MPRMPRSLAAAGLLLTLSSCTANPDASSSGAAESAAMAAVDEAPAELVAASDRLKDAWNGEDPEALARYFAADAVVVGDDSTYEGRDAIRDRWIRNGLPILSNLEISNRTFTGAGDTRAESGRYTYVATLPDSAPATMNGNYETTWVKQGEEWMVIRSVVKDDVPIE